MISPMTLPGTEVVCINDNKMAFAKPGILYIGGLDGLTKGKIYTVKEITPDPYERVTFIVILNEITRTVYRDRDPNGFAIERFRYLDLCGLDELLKVEVKEPERV